MVHRITSETEIPESEEEEILESSDEFILPSDIESDSSIDDCSDILPRSELRELELDVIGEENECIAATDTTPTRKRQVRN